MITALSVPVKNIIQYCYCAYVTKCIIVCFKIKSNDIFEGCNIKVKTIPGVT